MLATESPFPQYFDLDGTPLNNGSLYFGVANQNPETNPITVYWDSAGTQPAAQPIQTINGYTVRNGTPAIVFANVDYSINARNLRGNLVFTAASASASINDFALQASGGSALVGFIQAGTGAVARTVQSKLRDIFNIKDFGAVGDGATNNTSFIQAAIDAVQANGGGTLIVPVGTYLVTSLSVPSGVAVQLVGEGNKSLIKTTSATADVLTLAAWYSKVEGIRFESTVTRTDGSFVVLSGAFTKAVRCELAGDFYGIKMSGVGCKIQFNTFETPAANARRIWATGGDTSQTIEGNLMTAQVPVVSSSGIFVDNSSALKIIDNDIIGQGRCLHVAPGNGQSVFSLWSTGNFYDTATFGVAIEPTGTGAVRRVSLSDDWASSHTSSGMLLSASASAVIDGVDIDGCECNLNTVNGISLVGAGVTNVRIRNPLARQNNTAISVNASTKWLVDGLQAQAADGFNANATGLFLTSTDNYEVRDCDLTGQTTASISGHTTGISTRIVKNNKGYVTESEGIATITTGNTTVVVAHGLSATPNRVFVTALGDPAGRFWSQQSTWDGTNFTITQSGALGYNQPYAWRAVV